MTLTVALETFKPGVLIRRSVWTGITALPGADGGLDVSPSTYVLTDDDRAATDWLFADAEYFERGAWSP